MPSPRRAHFGTIGGMIGNRILGFKRLSGLWRISGLAAVVTATVAACAPSTDYDNPIYRELTWFDYLNANEIRSGCAPGAADRYRLIYNGVYIQQVRTYDVTMGPQDDSTHSLKTRVVVPRGQKPSSSEDPAGGMVEDPLALLGRGPGVVRAKTLDDIDMAALNQALNDSGFFGPPPTGTYLKAKDFYWIGAACVDGQFFFNPYKWPSDRFESATFPALLMSWDSTGIGINRPRNLSDFDVYGDESDGADKSTSFTVTVGENGLVGGGRLF